MHTYIHTVLSIKVLLPHSSLIHTVHTKSWSLVESTNSTYIHTVHIYSTYIHTYSALHQSLTSTFFPAVCAAMRVVAVVVVVAGGEHFKDTHLSVPLADVWRSARMDSDRETQPQYSKTSYPYIHTYIHTYKKHTYSRSSKKCDSFEPARPRQRMTSEASLDILEEIHPTLLHTHIHT